MKTNRSPEILGFLNAIDETLALASGWTMKERPKEDDLGPIGNLRETYWVGPGQNTYIWAYPTRPPCFHESLDLCARIKAKFNKNQQVDYIDHLYSIVRDQNDGPGTAATKAYFASALQQCEAIFKTLGLHKGVWCYNGKSFPVIDWSLAKHAGSNSPEG